MSATLHLDELVLRISGIDIVRAHSLGVEVAHRVAKRLACGGWRALPPGAVDMRLVVARGTSVEQIIEQLVDALTARLT